MPDNLKPIKSSDKSWKKKTFKVIFESDTPAGRMFDKILLWLILLSVGVVFLESINELRAELDEAFIILEWVFTLLFTIEYIFRVISVRNPLAYIFSFYGIVDLLAILPSYLSLFIPGGRYLLVIRILRLLRVFRIFKLTHFLTQADVLGKALKHSKEKIIVFLLTVITIVVIVGTLMYVIEGPQNGFTSIPLAIYWAIVTITTVGYGDISPQTPLGQIIASVLMITGYAIIAVPTGIITVELAQATRKQSKPDEVVCSKCNKNGHDNDARFCKFCGEKLA